MANHLHFRHATAGPATSRPMRPSTTRSGSERRWGGPVAVAALAVASLVGIDQLRPTDQDSPGSDDPGALIGVEEQAFIDARMSPVVRSSASGALIGVEEQAFIDARMSPVARSSGVTEQPEFIDVAHLPTPILDRCIERLPC